VASIEDRLAEIERALGDLSERLARLERAPARPAGVARRPMPPAPPTAEKPPPAPRPQIDLEDLLGGRVLAWVGGIAVLVGVVLFVGYAIREGWIDEATRLVLAFLASTALLLTGLYLYERKGQTEAATATVAASVAALYASLTAATTLYDLVEPTLGLGVALLIGAVATGIAVRWDSPLVAAIGIVGALLAPVLVDSDTSYAALGFMAVALLSAAGVLLWRRWDWLAAAAFVVSVPQLVAWLDDTYEDELAIALAVLGGFWAVYVVAAMLLLANAMLVGGAGWLMLDGTDHDDAATAWVLLVALVHVSLGAASFRGRISRDLASLLIAVGIGFSAIGLGLALSGPALVLAWAAEAAILSWIAGKTGDWRPHLAAGAFLALAAGHTVFFEAPPSALRDGVDDLGNAAVAIAAVGIAAAVAARQYRIDPPEWRTAFAVVAAAAAIYLPSIAIVDVTAAAEADPGQTPQVLLSAFWAVAGFGAVVYGLVREDRRLRVGGLVLLGLAVAKVFLYDLAQLESIYRVLSFIALGLLLLAGAFAYQRVRAQQR
jgi:uncharacterized membrane protein